MGGDHMGTCFWSTVEITQEGLTEIVLGAGTQIVRIFPEMGSNLFSYKVDDQEFLMNAGDINQKGVKFGGIPILFPTPNRVRGGVFLYKGKAYPQVKNGETRLIHGLVCDERWNYENPIVENNTVKVVTVLCVEKGHPIYDAFPFPFLLRMTYTLSLQGLTILYSVENLGDECLPFGFALHPFFGKIDAEASIFIQVPAENVMEADACMPSGKLLKVESTRYDIRQPRALQDLDLDDVYWKLNATQKAVIEYRTLGRKMELSASDDFSHMVVFTPKDRPCFCLENQTCSTDAHNLYAAGLEGISGLIRLPPGDIHEGWIRFTPGTL